MAYNQGYVNLLNVVAIFTLQFFLATSLVASPNTDAAIDPKTAGLLDFIGSIEAPGGYDTISYYASSPPPRPLTQMTIGQVLAYQNRIDPHSRSEAMGRFQIMNYTLAGLIREHGLNTKQLFNEPTQNRLALLLLKRRGWNPNSREYVKMANSLAHEWAALPLVSGPDKGKSAYRNTKGAKNRAQVTPAIFMDVLKNGNKSNIVRRAVKLSRTHRRVASIESRGFKIRRISSVKNVKPSNVTGGAITPSKIIVFNTDPYRMD